MDRKTSEALFEHSAIGIIISSEDGIIEKANSYAEKMFGFSSNELIGKGIEVLVPLHLRKKHIQDRADYNKNPVPRAMGANLGLMAVKKDSTLFPVEVSLTFFEVEGRRQIVSFISDITERKRAENDLRRLTEELESKVSERTKELSDALLELSHTNEGLQQEMESRKKVEEQIRGMLESEKELNELKSRFVSMASHEFRTPLGGILTSVSLIAKYPTTEEKPKRDKHILSIKNSVKNLTDILNDFLSLDKLEQGKMHSSPCQFDFVGFLDESVEELQETSDKGHKFVVTHSESSLPIFQDKGILRNVIINLISNAIKYSPDMSTIYVRTKLSEGNIIFEVEDQGMGIPQEDQKHLFGRFFRAKNVTNVQGTGLGLNIVKSYLELMSAKIDFISRENEGTTFIVSIPVEKR